MPSEAKCLHWKPMTVQYLLRRPSVDGTDSGWVDFDFARQYLIEKFSFKDFEHPTPEELSPIQEIKLCPDCYAMLPSEAKRHALLKSKKAKPQEEKDAEAEELQEAKERLEAGDTFYYCKSCETFKDEDEALPLWECSHDSCGDQHVGEDRACESCNRPFSRKLAEHACEECQEEVEEVTAELLTEIRG